ncbi:MAG TPA: M42 family metallopeptidase, partial [Anaerolineales bacterium]|nr:M42 family metallopeptidase [Anaerolineales bacterium]
PTQTFEMENQLFEKLQKLTALSAPTGQEHVVRSYLTAEIEKLGYISQVDRLGNLTVTTGTPNAPHLLLVAHMDEIGVIVSHVDKRGFCYLQPLGGISTTILIGCRVQFANGVQGVIHNEGTGYRTPGSFDEIYVDVGATSASDCPLQVGDIAGYVSPLQRVGNTRATGKSIDDRVGCLILLEALANAKNSPWQVTFAWSVQEEIGVRGAGALAFAVDPQVALSVDVTRTGDVPETTRMAVRLGGGPAIKLRDAGMIADSRVVQAMQESAQAHGIPFQREILANGSTDARAVQISRGGVLAGCLSIPCRYVHSINEMVDLQDVSNSIKLLQSFIHSQETLNSLVREH